MAKMIDTSKPAELYIRVGGEALYFWTNGKTFRMVESNQCEGCGEDIAQSGQLGSGNVIRCATCGVFYNIRNA
jgi:hypothetical protein